MSSVHLIYGENAFDRKQALQEILKHNQHADTIRLDGETIKQVSNIETHLSSLDLFGNDKCIILQDFISAGKSIDVKNALLDILKTQNFDGITLIFYESSAPKKTLKIVKWLMENANTHACETNSASQLLAFIQSHTQELYGQISKECAQFLLQTTGHDKQKISKEIEKLLCYENTITKENIRLLCNPELQEKSFELYEMLLSHNVSGFVSECFVIEQKQINIFQMLPAIQYKSRVAISIKIGMSEGVSPQNMPKMFGIPPFEVQKSRAKIQNTETKTLINIHQKLLKLEHTLKSSQENPYNLMRNLIL